MATIARDLDPDKSHREPFALKAPYVLSRVTFNPSSAKPGETLYVDIPWLSENAVIVPGTVFLRYDIKTTFATENQESFLVDNAGRNLVKRLRVLFGGKVLQDLYRYDLFMGFHDMFHHKEFMKQGICSEALRKYRAGAKTLDAGVAKIGGAWGRKLYIPIDHPILYGNGAFYQNGLSHQFRFELTLADAGDIIKAVDPFEASSIMSY